MSQQSNIEWTDATWNPVRGCVKVSPGCANCYAETFAERWRGVPGHPYEQGFDLRLVPDKLNEPLFRKKPTTYFVNSMSDLFQDGVPDDYIDAVFGVMGCAPQHTFQVLTKRADRMRQWAQSRNAQQIHEAAKHHLGYHNPIHRAVNDWPLPNVWLGVSVENQHFADERIPLLLRTPAAVRFISAEPLLGPVGLSPWLPIETIGGVEMERWLDWVIVGGESGAGARPCALEWIEAIVQQCQSAHVPVFVKQLGAYVVSELRTMLVGNVFSPAKLKLEHFAKQYPDEVWAWRAGLKSKKGGDMAEWPADLRVREFPS